MNINRCKPSEYLDQLEALNRRLLDNHHRKSDIVNQLIKEKAGIRGENSLDFPLQFLPQDNYTLIHQPRVKDDHKHFQMDTILISSRYLLIMEVKNWFGTLLFDDERQVVRVRENGLEEGMPSPITQVKLQKHRLEKWLSNKKLNDIPIIHAVVISFPTTIIKPMYPNMEIPQCVVHSNQLPLFIKQLNQKYPRVLSSDLIEKVSDEIISNHIPYQVNVLEKFKINREELLKGVLCPNCHGITLDYWYGKWNCINCKYQSSNEHHLAFNDYRLLIGETITNSEAREFLCLESCNVAKYLLKKLGYKISGHNKGRCYHLENLPIYPRNYRYN